MKFLFFTVFLILASFFVFAQNPAVTPAVTDELCPAVDIPIQFTGATSSDFTIKSDATLKGCTMTTNIDGSGRAVLKFTDKKEAHEFVLYNHVTSVSYTYKFTKIKTIDGLKPTYPPGTPGITPYTPDYDDAINTTILPPCGAPSIQYTCPVLKYKDAAGTEFGTFGMSFSEWLVPKGWKVNGTVSDGVNHIGTSGNAATITADPIMGGELKYRAKNDCNPNTLKQSGYYKVLILRPSLRLTAGGQNPVTINCGETVSRTFTLENINAYSSCLTGTYVWKLGSAPNGWKDANGNPAPATITTSTPSLTLAYAGTLTPPSNVAVELTHLNGSVYTFTSAVNFVQCTASVFNISPSSVPVACSVPVTHTFTVNTVGNIAGITGYVWNLGSASNGWKEAGGNPAPASITTTGPSLTLTSDGGYSAPSNVVATPYVDNIAFPYSYTAFVNFTRCCASPPTNLTATSSGSPGYVFLGWSPVLSASNYTVEYMAADGSNHVISTVTSTSISYYGPANLSAKFRVKATCGNGLSSDWTEWKTFSTSPCVLPVPTNLVAAGSCGTPGTLCGYVYYNWTPVSGATGYEVEAVVFNISTGQIRPSTIFQIAAPPIYYGTYSGISGTGWSIHYRVRVKCSNNQWTNFSDWSPTFAL